MEELQVLGYDGEKLYPFNKLMEEYNESFHFAIASGFMHSQV